MAGKAEKRRIHTLNQAFFLSPVINRQGYSPFPRKKRAQKPRYQIEATKSRKNRTIAQKSNNRAKIEQSRKNGAKNNVYASVPSR